MTISRRQIGLIKVAVKTLGWSDDTYRSALAQIGGVTTSTDLDKTGFEALFGYFEYCGFEPLQAKGPSYGQRPGMASFAQIELIRNLWAEYTHRAYPGQDELNKWLERCFKVSSLRFLKKDTAPKVITALKAMKLRAA
ncbi:regulatory protein GemA [Pseudorhodobacter sp.]|uniref:regulatory protein GemA n=1 Tax=Pseudorhodobacter sp. TaxID=1934400 RepID=UPI002AFE851B|nr:regulatory protein GemA [Pseudorhodobacter sp.]